MPKNYLKKYIPNPEKLKKNKALGVLGSQIYEANLWHLNRRSVSRAFFNGLFWALLPVPLQMIAAALFAIPMRANIPLSITLVWVTNPVTIPFVFYFNYKLGTLILGYHEKPHFKLSIEWIWLKLEEIWLPLYVGSITAGLVAGILGYVTIGVLWRIHAIKRWKRRHLRKPLK